jgi:hypothetical protein
MGALDLTYDLLLIVTPVAVLYPAWRYILRGRQGLFELSWQRKLLALAVFVSAIIFLTYVFAYLDTFGGHDLEWQVVTF